jgi:hypothetical protein
LVSGRRFSFVKRIDNFTLAMGAVGLVFALGIIQAIEALARY